MEQQESVKVIINAVGIYDKLLEVREAALGDIEHVAANHNRLFDLHGNNVANEIPELYRTYRVMRIVDTLINDGPKKDSEQLYYNLRMLI